MVVFEQTLPILPLFHAICAILYSVLIGYILIKNPKASANQLCAMVLLCFFVWCLGKVVSHFPGVPFSLVSFIQKFVVLGAWSFSTFILLFTFALTGKNRLLKNKAVWLSLFAIPVLSIALQWYDGRLMDYVPRSFGWGLSWQYGFFSFLLLGYIFLTNVVSAGVCLLYSMTSTSRSKRIQCRIIGMCILAGVIIGYGTNYVAPILQWELPDLAQNLGLIWLGGLVFAITKFDLFVVNPTVATNEILSNMSDVVILVDSNGQINTINSAGLSLLKSLIEDTKGVNLENILPAENGITYDAEGILATREVTDKDCTLIASDGEQIPVSLSVSSSTSNGCESGGLLIIARDISERVKYREKLQNSHSALENRVRERTAELVELNKKLTSEVTQRKKAADSLEQNEAMFRLISEQSLLGIVILSDNRIVYANKAWADITEYTVEEMLTWDPKAFLTRVHPEDREHMLEQAEKKQQGSNDFEASYDWRLITKSGKEKWISMYSRPVPYGGATADLATMVDITEKKNVFISLQQSEAKYRLLVENAGDGIFILQDEVIRFVNKKAIEVTGYSREELLLTPFVNLIHPEDRRAAKTRYDKRIEGENVPTTHSFRAINKSGETLWIQSNAIEFNWRDQPAVLSFVRDITHTQKIENMLNHMHRQEALGTMASGIANDFNNILAPILGYSEILEEELRQDREKHEKITEILDGAIRAKELINQILTLSTSQPSEKEEVDIYAVVKESINLNRAILPHSIEIQHNLEEQCGRVLAVPAQLHQIIMNIVGNAHQAMSDKGGTLTLLLEEKEGYDFKGTIRQSYVHLQICDTGRGMDQEVLEKIFSPYFTTKENSSGLGLSVAYALIKEMNGHIDVESKIGEGTCVDIFLPASSALEKPQITSKAVNPTLTGQENIMLVDDEAPVLKLYEQILVNKGYQVAKFEDSPSALNEFNQSPFDYDLVITDMSMPDMCGDEIAKKIQDKRPDIPIIICTGYSDAFSEKDAAAIGINAYLRKPVTSIDSVYISR